MAFNGLFDLHVDLRQTPAAPYDQAAHIAFDRAQRYASGVSAGLGDKVYAITATLGAGASTTYDLLAILDAYGAAVNAGGIVGFVFEADAANGANIRFTATGVNEWLGIVTTGSSIKVPPGCVIAGSSPSTAALDRWTVAAGSKVLTVENMDGAAGATFTLILISKT